ncbi:uncharacterized protein [Phaseolus vulgaris]|uniref:uncharacterized protein n=1 Tax=Phaseolus vulgaris TaxID=3885 RepID=UPI0035CA276B
MPEAVDLNETPSCPAVLSSGSLSRDPTTLTLVNARGSYGTTAKPTQKSIAIIFRKNRSYIEERNIELEDRYNALIRKSLPKKFKDSGSFNLPVSIGALYVDNALLDLGASINLIPWAMLKKIGDLEIKPTKMTLKLADQVTKYPYGMVEDVLVKVDKFTFPVDFVVMDVDPAC